MDRQFPKGRSPKQVWFFEMLRKATDEPESLPEILPAWFLSALEDLDIAEILTRRQVEVFADLSGGAPLCLKRCDGFQTQRSCELLYTSQSSRISLFLSPKLLRSILNRTTSARLSSLSTSSCSRQNLFQCIPLGRCIGLWRP